MHQNYRTFYNLDLTLSEGYKGISRDNFFLNCSVIESILFAISEILGSIYRCYFLFRFFFYLCCVFVISPRTFIGVSLDNSIYFGRAILG